jgi:mannose-6-phosphate isomerase-like protein (cupin superfamily)
MSRVVLCDTIGEPASKRREGACGEGVATMINEQDERRPVVLEPGEGRLYSMGRISALFKADGAQTGHGYSISEWWLDPYTTGPGAHLHPEDDVFYVLAGTMSVLVGTEWFEGRAGSFILVPGNVTHDFENRGAERAGILNVKIPGADFEEEMPGIVQWFAEHPPSDSRTRGC